MSPLRDCPACRLPSGDSIAHIVHSDACWHPLVQVTHSSLIDSPLARLRLSGADDVRLQAAHSLYVIHAAYTFVKYQAGGGEGVDFLEVLKGKVRRHIADSRKIFLVVPLQLNNVQSQQEAPHPETNQPQGLLEPQGVPMSIGVQDRPI